MTDILADRDAREPAFGRGNPLELSRPAAAKTGTTNDNRDSWTVGYTPQLVTGVWVGNNNNHSMNDVTGISGAAPIWHAIMEYAHTRGSNGSCVRSPGCCRPVTAPNGGSCSTSIRCAALTRNPSNRMCIGKATRSMSVPDAWPTPRHRRVVWSKSCFLTIRRKLGRGEGKCDGRGFRLLSARLWRGDATGCLAADR